MKLNIILPLICSIALSVTTISCIDEETPSTVVSEEQLGNVNNLTEKMLYGISSYMVSYNAWGSSSTYLYDWGYPCQMYLREVNGEDFPVYRSTYDYWTYHENGTYLSYFSYYGWYFYYKLIKNCNDLIAKVDVKTADTNTKRNLGSALAFRAMAYLDLARSYEYKPTGYAKDQVAADSALYGLTVPIVTEKTTEAEERNNPRAEFCKMYRFIMTDLQNAKTYLNGYNPSDVSLPGSRAVNGLMARVWMEIGSRYEESNQYLSDYADKMRQSNESKDGYTQITALTAKECYENALNCAENAMSGLTATTEKEWHDATTGFNTATNSWIWRCRIGGKEQEPAYYCSFQGQISSEALSGLPYSYDAYRCIGSYLYEQISDNDWRKTTWIAPNEAGKGTTAVRTKYQTLLDSSQFVKLPQYANLKFRPGNGDISDIYTWMISDLPVMRMEEMEFIKAEAIARTQGYKEGVTELKNFINNNRYSKKTYSPKCRDLADFMYELMIQKRIEFWGEGVTFFDYKRLNLRVDRSQSTNTPSSFQISSNYDKCCPWMIYFIPTSETQRNTACKANPDLSGSY